MVIMGKFPKPIVIIAFLLFSLTLTCYRIFSLWNRFLPDFSVFYYGSQALVHQINPYKSTLIFTGIGYPLSSLFIYTPLLIFPYQIAQNIFLLLNIIALYALVYISLSIVKRLTRLYFLFFLSLALLSFPASFTLGMGQSNIIGYTFLLLGYYLFTHKRHWTGGICLSLAYITKPILLFTILFFLIQKKWRIFLTCSIMLLLVFIVSVTIFNHTYSLYYITHILPQLLNFTGREVYYNQGITGFIARLTANIFIRKLVSACFGILSLGILLYLTQRKDQKSDLLFSLYLITLLLSDSLSWQHHFVILLFPFICTFFLIQKKKRNYWLMGLLTLSYLLVSGNMKHPGIFLTFPWVLLLSHVFYGTILLYGLSLYLLLKPSLTKKTVLTTTYCVFLLFITVQYVLFITCRSSICLR